MAIRFKCSNDKCQKPLAVKDHLAGKKAVCPDCKQTTVIPKPVDMEALAASTLADLLPSDKPAAPVSDRKIDFTCPFCDEELHFEPEMGGKKAPCPACKRIINVPKLEVEKPKDWRTVMRAGPTAARINMPEMPNDAWDAAQKTVVRQSSLEEADALPEVKEPIGVAGWIKRGLIAVVAISLAVFIWRSVGQHQDLKQETNAIDEALKFVDTPAKRPPLVNAEIHRAIGELYIGRDKAAEALDYFRKARAILSPTAENNSAIEQDLFLTRLALSLLDLGGNEEQTMAHARLDWKTEVKKQLTQTLDAMTSIEGRLICLREVNTWLLAKGQTELASGLAMPLAGSAQDPKNSPYMTQVFAVLYVTNPKMADGLPLKMPDLDKGPVDSIPRLAFVEGLARKGDYEKALALTQAKGLAEHRLDACLAAADIARADAKEKATPFLEEALNVIQEMKNKKDRPSNWQLVYLARVSAGTGMADKAKAEVKQIDGVSTRSLAQLYLLGGQWSASGTRAEPASLDELDEKEGSIRALAWEELARHNAHIGAGATETTDENYKPMVFLGAALGEKDRK